MLDNLTNRLARVMKTLKGEARLTESNIADALREVRMALLEADVALPVVKDFIAAVKEKAVGEEVLGSLSPGQALVGVVHRELTRLMGEAHEAIASLALAVVVVHVAAAIIMSLLQKENLVKSMVTGKKQGLPEEAIQRVSRTYRFQVVCGIGCACL